MTYRIWIILVLVLCVFFVFLFAPFGEKLEQKPLEKSTETVLTAPH